MNQAEKIVWQVFGELKKAELDVGRASLRMSALDELKQAADLAGALNRAACQLEGVLPAKKLEEFYDRLEVFKNQTDG